MNPLRKLAGETAIYGASSIIGRMLNYLLVPYYTGVFAAGEYGVVTELYAYAAFFNVLYLYGMETAYFRFASRHEGGEARVFNQSFLLVFCTSLLFSGLLLSFAQPIAGSIGYEGNALFIRWFALILAIDAIVAIPFARLRYEGKAVWFASAKLINIGANIGFNLFFLSVCPYVLRGEGLGFLYPLVSKVYNPDFGVEYVFLSNLLANALLLLFLGKVLMRVRWSWNLPLLSEMWRYAYPLLFTGLAFVTNEMLSRVMLRHWLPEGFYGDKSNLAAVGIFGAVYKLAMLISLGIQAFRYASEPFFFHRAADKNSPELFAKVMHWFIIIAAVVFLAVSLNLDILQHLLRREEYREGIHVVPLLMLGSIFLGIYSNISIWYKLTDRTHFSTWITLSAALLTLVLNYLLIPIWGYEGSALVTFMAYFFMATVSFVLGQKYYPIPYKVGAGLSYIASAAVLAFLLWDFYFVNQWVTSAFHFAVLGAYVAMVYWIEKPRLAD
jgi:O-antigen/teichoic acid export membrane protein